MSGSTKYCAEINEDESWETLKNKINQVDLKHIRKPEREQINYIKYLKTAATWLLLFGFGSALTWWLTDRTEEAAVKIAFRSIEVISPLGSRSIIRMPDKFSDLA